MGEIIHSVGPAGPVIDVEGDVWINAQPDVNQTPFWLIKLSTKDARLEPIADGISVDLAMQIAERAGHPLAIRQRRLYRRDQRNAHNQVLQGLWTRILQRVGGFPVSP